MKVIDQYLIFKTILYRLLSSIVIFSLSYFFTREMIISFGISGLELLLKIIIYYVYELVWRRIEKVVKK